MRVRITRAATATGTVVVPGDKSISHRALILGALSEGACRVTHLALGADVRSTARCLAGLGAELRLDGATAMIHGRGLGSLRASSGSLDCGNSGTSMRLLSGVLAGSGVGGVLDGDASLRRRPMRRVLDPLRAMGAECSGERRPDGGEVAPLRFSGGRRLVGAHHRLPVSSAQVKSALLLAGLWADGETVVEEPQPSRDHTERMLEAFGASLTQGAGGAVAVRRSRRALLPPPSLEVPGDISSAAFFIATAGLVPGGHVHLDGVGVNPGRVGFLRFFERMGGHCVLSGQESRSGEPVALLDIGHAPALVSSEAKAEEIPAMIDEVPILAVLATQAKGTTTIRGAGELRVKESDRIAHMAAGLRAMGARVEELPDGLVIDGPAALRGARIDSGGDHRIAMSFAVAGLVADGETVVDHAEWVDISYPGFFDVLAQMTRGAVVLEHDPV